MKLMRIIRVLIASTLIGLLVSCASSDPKVSDSVKSNSYGKHISNVLVVVDIAHLEKAFAEIGGVNNKTDAVKKQAEVNARAVGAVLADSISEKMANLGVKATPSVFASGGDNLALARIISRDRRAQILLLNTAQFETLTSTSYPPGLASYSTSLGWSGRLSWSLALLDMDRTANPDGSPVWKLQTNMFNFGMSACLKDQYKECADKLAKVIVEQLHKDNLLPKTNPKEVK